MWRVWCVVLGGFGESAVWAAEHCARSEGCCAGALGGEAEGAELQLHFEETQENGEQVEELKTFTERNSGVNM